MIKMNEGVFSIETANTGYYMALRDDLLENLHYGKKIHIDRAALCEKMPVGYGTDVVYRKETAPLSLMHLCLEVSPADKGDFRKNALDVILPDGSRACEYSFKSARLVEGNLAPEGMPSAYGAESTLVLTFTSAQGVTLQLYYSVYPDCDVITRRMRIENKSGGEIVIRRALSYQLDLPETGFVLSTFTGAWGRERHETEGLLTRGTRSFGSTTGVSSHFCNPFFMVSEAQAGEETGRVYGFNLIYSGSHYGQAETGPYAKTRIMAGIQPEGFSWTLKDQESFDTPEAVLAFSAKGKNGLSQCMHRFVRRHIVRGVWARKERPVLINNWEATYMNFNEGRLLDIAREAKNLGIELFVLDDGWFGQRNDDKRSLGDYDVNRKKLPGGLSGLARKIRKLGMGFGLWMEPEMVNPDSDLYRAHPDWAVKVPGRTPSLCRSQLVLDLCRSEVQDYIIEKVNETIKSAPISYVKWDMNRTLTDVYSLSLTEQGRFWHTWVLGLYRILGAVTEANPKVLFEACASGGNRFDLGILCYMPQIWTSDDTDAYERMKIQTGTSYGYPPSVMGCHVSAVPNHQTLRRSPIESRFAVAAFGLLGYELDLTALSQTEKKAVAAQVAFYKEHRRLFQYGQFYRLSSPFKDAESCRWMVVSGDKKEAMLLDGVGRVQPNMEQEPVRLTGLNPQLRYSITARRQIFDIRSLGGLINMVLPVRVNESGLLVHVASDHYARETEQESYRAYGDLLMEAGLKLNPRFGGTGYNDQVRMMEDYGTRIYILKAEDANGRGNV